MASEVRWHLNPETGKPGRCSAKKQCRFGLDSEDHHETFAAAQQAYEKSMEQETFSAFAKEATQAPAPAEEQVPTREEFTRRIPAGAPLSDYVKAGDYLKYKNTIIKVKDFTYQRPLLAYEIETEGGETVYVNDYDWYETSTLSVVDNRPPVEPEAFETPAEAHQLMPQQRFTTDESDTIYTVVKIEHAEYSYDPHTEVYVEEQEEPLKIYWHEAEHPRSDYSPPRPTHVFLQGEVS